MHRAGAALAFAGIGALAIGSPASAATRTWTTVQAQATLASTFHFAVKAKVLGVHCNGSTHPIRIAGNRRYSQFSCTVSGQKSEEPYTQALAAAKAAYKQALASGDSAAIQKAKAALLTAEANLAEYVAHGGEVAANVDVLVISATRYKLLDCSTASAPLSETVCP